MFLLGVPLAAPLAVIVFLGRFIPYIGGLITTGIVLLVALGHRGNDRRIVLLVLIVDPGVSSRASSSPR